ncbi:hypothetical protein BASA62_005030 [Batrachochytrium salamandrivorans]|nr:hypothetical protein BASA62_005030 [Batrachochytrium salamandrivorans]
MRNVYGVNISDNQDDQATSSLHINITSYAIIHPENRLYNSAGVIDITRLQTLLKASNNNLMSVTGLFKFRRNVLISPSVRDEAVYESLQQIRLASGIDASVVDHQLLGLFTATMDDAATMTQEFGFMHRPAALIVHGDTNRVGHPSVQFTRLPSKISNMHDQGSTGIYNSSQLPFFWEPLCLGYRKEVA